MASFSTNSTTTRSALLDLIRRLAGLAPQSKTPAEHHAAALRREAARAAADRLLR